MRFRFNRAFTPLDKNNNSGIDYGNASGRMRKMKHFQSLTGFTLLEVLITVAILSTAIIFIFRSYTASLSSSKFSQDITLACYLVEDKLWEIEQDYKNNPNPVTSGVETIEKQNKDFDCGYEILDTVIVGLKELKLTVSWKENIRENKYTLEFLTYLPPK